MNFELLLNIDLAKKLLKDARLNISIEHFERINKGGNNQLFKVTTDQGSFMMKKYFHHKDDPRNRLSTEYSFIEYAHQRAPSYVPKAITKCDDSKVALYEFIDGVKLQSSADLDKSHIEQAAEFISKLNDQNLNPHEITFNASEACFSIDDHINIIDKRLSELLSINNKLDQLNNTLQKILLKWLKIKTEVYKSCSEFNIPTKDFLEYSNRILSPSDFGFHNAILNKNNRLVFIDFEYAGWDDPAKLVGDFFSQIAVPVDPKFFSYFVRLSLGKKLIHNSDFFRIQLLFNAYRIKWCCIILNIFLEKNLERRLFSNPLINIDKLQSDQINKANILIESINL